MHDRSSDAYEAPSLLIFTIPTPNTSRSQLDNIFIFMHAFCVARLPMGISMSVKQMGLYMGMTVHVLGRESKGTGTETSE